MRGNWSAAFDTIRVTALALACVSISQIGRAQCQDSTTMWGYTAEIDRVGSNSVVASAGSETFGDYWYDWAAYVQSTEYVNSTVLHTGEQQAGYGGQALIQWTDAPSSAGTGTYSNSNTHVWQSSCGDYGSLPSSSSLAVSPPARPDYASGQPTALWYLGPGVTSDGNYSAQTVFTPGNPNGATGTPTWVIANGSDKLSLSCTNCTNPTATAIKQSGGCQSYDVQVNTSYDGLVSDPFYLFVNRPWNTVATNDPVGGTWVYSLAMGNGYETHVNYQISGLCALDPPMSGYDVNEQLTGGLVPDYPGDNWFSFPAGATYVGGTSWFDKISISDVGSAPGDPAYCGDGVLCVPQFTNPGQGPHTLVDHIPQTWFVGSGTSGSGARVQYDTLQRYTDSGWHTDIVTPDP